jgi:anti-anti-sigma factor
MSYLPPTFELAEEALDGHTAVLTVHGEIHLATAPQFADRLNAVVDSGGTAVVVDLTDVGFVDSTGLTVLLNGLRRITLAGGGLVLVCTNPTVLRHFEMTKLHETFQIVASRDEAVVRARGTAAGAASSPQ